MDHTTHAVDPYLQPVEGRKWILPVLLAIFGFPIAGLSFFWWHAQRNIEQSARPYVLEKIPVWLDQDDRVMLEASPVPWFQKEFDWAAYEQWPAKYGDFVAVNNLEYRTMEAGESETKEVYQLAHFKARVKFEKSEQDVYITIARKTLDLKKRWELAYLNIGQPANKQEPAAKTFDAELGRIQAKDKQAQENAPK